MFSWHTGTTWLPFSTLQMNNDIERIRQSLSLMINIVSNSTRILSRCFSFMRTQHDVTSSSDFHKRLAWIKMCARKLTKENETKSFFQLMRRSRAFWWGLYLSDEKIDKNSFWRMGSFQICSKLIQKNLRRCYSFIQNKANMWNFHEISIKKVLRIY